MEISISIIIGILLVFFYFFAIIGMEIFGGQITSNELYCGNSALKDSTFYADGYCSNNFNDLFASLVTLFELMTVNQWHVITEGYVLVTSKAARLYFFAFHLLCVTVILNIFSAFVIEAFILEFNQHCMQSLQTLQQPLMRKIAAMGLAYGKLEALESEDLEDEETLVDADHNFAIDHEQEPEQPGLDVPNVSVQTGLRFCLTSRTRTVMGLLEKMFETDLLDSSW